jgi:hypothetical protein
VPARGIGEEKAVRFLKTAFAEVMQLVGFALPDKNDGEPAAAGAGRRGSLGWFHSVITDYGKTGKL